MIEKGNSTLHEFKQFISCTKSQYTLDFEALKRFLFSISGSKASINLLGGDLFQYKRLNEILFILEGMDNSYTLILDWRNLPDLNDIKKYESLQLKLLSHEPFESEEVMKAARRIAKSGIAYSWELYVSSEEEYEKAAILKEMLANFSDVSIRPFYNGENRSFFENFVYTDQEELDSIAWNRQNIFALQALNMNNFGKITILSDGKVYANVNEAPIGTIQDPIKDLLVKELESKNAWRKTRYDVEPCAHCRFKLICPSPSNYERVIGKNNLCHILK